MWEKEKGDSSQDAQATTHSSLFLLLGLVLLALLRPTDTGHDGVFFCVEVLKKKRADLRWRQKAKRDSF